MAVGLCVCVRVCACVYITCVLVVCVCVCVSIVHVGLSLDEIQKCSVKSQVTFTEYGLFYRALLQKRPVILSILLAKATP